MRTRLVLCALGLSGCVHLSAVTTPPPTRTAELDDSAETIEVSVGAALGFECWHTNFFDAGPCAKGKARTDDPNVAQVFPAYLDHLVPSTYWRSRAQQSGFVIVGISPGATTLRIETNGTEDEYVVKVVK